MIAAAAHFNLVADGPTRARLGRRAGAGVPRRPGPLRGGAARSRSAARRRPTCRPATGQKGSRAVETDEYLAQLRLEGGRLATAARAAPTRAGAELSRTGTCRTAPRAHRRHPPLGGRDPAHQGDRPWRAAREAGDEVAFADLAAAYDAGLDALVAALAATDPDEPVWNWSPTHAAAPARFWFRRMAQETAVHRWDAEAAAGTAVADRRRARRRRRRRVPRVRRRYHRPRTRSRDSTGRSRSSPPTPAPAGTSSWHRDRRRTPTRRTAAQATVTRRGLGPLPLAPPPDPAASRRGDRRGATRAPSTPGGSWSSTDRDGARPRRPGRQHSGPPVCQGAAAPVSLALETRECQRSHRRPRK